MEKLTLIFNFLKENRQYNHAVQSAYYSRILAPYNNTADKVTALLHSIVNTQSQPKMDKLAVFFQKIHNNRSKLNTFEDFLAIFGKRELCYKTLYEALNNEKGWGPKTAALFCKTIYHLHCGTYDESLKIWEDAPTTITDNDKLYLPVDAVILRIFSELAIPEIRIDFYGINNLLQDKYKADAMEFWDDLWFWGFISQKTVQQERKLQWNEAKYWSLLETDKRPIKIQEIKRKAMIFIALVNPNL